MKFIVLIGMMFMLMGVSKCPNEKYMAPMFEDCSIIVEYSEEAKVDKSTIMCYDESITIETYENEFIPRVMNRFKGHPLENEIRDLLIMSRDKIITTHEYELPIRYAYGYTSISQNDRTKLMKWAEENRMERIKCEYSPRK